MKLTAKQVQTDIMALLRGSDLVQELNGKVYRNGYRPHNSKAEDTIVSFTTGTADQIEEGVVTLNIFVPDIDPYRNGILVEDGERTNEIEMLAQAWVESLTTAISNYKFQLQQTIYTENEPDIFQHFVVVRLRYKYFK